MFAFVHKKKKKNKYPNQRMTFLKIVILLFGALIISKQLHLQLFEHDKYSQAALKQHGLVRELQAERGEIFTLDNTYKDIPDIVPLVKNIELNLVYAVPYAIDIDIDEFIGKIMPVLNKSNAKIADDQEREQKLLKELKDQVMEAENIDELERLLEKEKQRIQDAEENEFLDLKTRLSKKDDPYEPIKHLVDDEVVNELKKLELSGLAFQKENFRFYLEKNIGSNLTGFYGFNGNERMGRYGVEGYFDSILRGANGIQQIEKDVHGRTITLSERIIEDPVDGADIVLTIDSTIQYKACNSLNNWVLRHGADGGSVIVLEAKTAAILAMCSAPDYNPNEYSDVKDISIFNNPVVSEQYEPGSIFKPITMAVAVNQGKVESTTTYEDTGKVEFKEYTIRNSDKKAHGRVTMTEVLQLSLNTGAVFAVNQVGGEIFAQYVRDFGFGHQTGIPQTHEAYGYIKNLDLRNIVYTATASYGQGISVTPLQMAASYQILANQGVKREPYLVKEIIYPDGRVESPEEGEGKRVLSQHTASVITGMLISVVERGHGTKARVPGYLIAGKTGTAQVPKKNGLGYDPNFSIGSFAGFFPAEDPHFVMLVKIDNPKGVIWAESSAAPLFGQLAEFILNYYKIPPSIADDGK